MTYRNQITVHIHELIKKPHHETKSNFIHQRVHHHFSLTVCHQNTSKNSETNVDPAVNKKLNAVFNNYWEERMKLFPFDATFAGDNRYNDQFPNDQTQSFCDSLTNFYLTYLDSVKSFDRSKLTDENKISYDIFVYEMKRQLDRLKLNTWMIPFDQFNGLPQRLPLGNTMFPFKTVKDYDNWLSRLNKFSAWTDSAIGNFRKGMAAGVALPKALVVKTIQQLESMVVTDPTKSLFYQPITHLPKDISAADSQRLVNDYRKKEGVNQLFGVNEDTNPEVISQFDCVALHELGHIFLKRYNETHTHKKWADEFLTSYFAICFLQQHKNYPGLPQIDETGYHPKYKTLNNFERLYSNVDAPNYGWYQGEFQEPGKRLYPKFKVELIKKFIANDSANGKKLDPLVLLR